MGFGVEDMLDMPITIVGIDCSANPQKVGLVLASVIDSKARLLQAQIGKRKPSIPKTVAAWISESEFTLLALDAPLGWPIAMGNALVSHRAGEPLLENPDAMFRRLTDMVVKKEIRKTPLEVGANLIARTAHSALCLLEELRRITEQPIPLAWSPQTKSHLAVIEVYPAATLAAHGFPASGYKKGQTVSNRKAIVSGIRRYLEVQNHESILLKYHDALDATICVIAALDFLAGKSIQPSDFDMEHVRKEGWIWVRQPQPR